MLKDMYLYMQHNDINVNIFCGIRLSLSSNTTGCEMFIFSFFTKLPKCCFVAVDYRVQPCLMGHRRMLAGCYNLHSKVLLRFQDDKHLSHLMTSAMMKWTMCLSPLQLECCRWMSAIQDDVLVMDSSKRAQSRNIHRRCYLTLIICPLHLCTRPHLED